MINETIIEQQKTTARLSALRKLMAERGLQAYFVPSEDAHQNEYIAKWDARRAFISGFTGSAGFAVVTSTLAALWTDGRYFLQAEKQLDENWILMKAGLKETPTKEAWLAQVLSGGSKIGADSRLISVDGANRFRDGLLKHQKADEAPLELVLEAENLVDKIWTDRPQAHFESIQALPTKYSGREYGEKLAKLQEMLKEQKYSGFIVTALDEIAWLFNLRGSDIPYNPVFFAYAWITSTNATLYCHQEKMIGESKSALGSLVKLRPYEAIMPDLKAVRMEAQAKGDFSEWKVLAGNGCNCMLAEAIGRDRLVLKQSPIELEKAIKNEVEVEGFRQCHIRDGAALCSYFAWLQEQLSKGAAIDEVDGSDKLEQFRRAQPDCVGPSFDTISGVGANAAIIHYKPEKPSAARITLDQIYLCDSGGQYRDGSTDVTRTLHFGMPTDEERDAFTRVLKGNIALDRAIFPRGTTGFMLDCLARLPLWAAGLDYRHGTGHGVGHFLNIHEGPHSISFHIRSNDHPFLPGMTVTDEPGYYADGRFGIRIENVLVVRDAETPNNFGGVGFLCFENVTMVPIQTKLIKRDMLNQDEVDWINKYHAKVWEKVSPLLQGSARDWLAQETRPI